MLCLIIVTIHHQVLALRRDQPYGHSCPSASDAIVSSGFAPLACAADAADQASHSPSAMHAAHLASLRQVLLADELHRTKLKYR